jgi:DNA-binding PadR family transcriptional regulator
MTIIDMLLLETLNKPGTKLKIRELYNKLNSLEISCCVTSIYRRLNNLKVKNFIEIDWKEGNKFYSISDSGKHCIDTFKNQLKI